MRHLTSGDLSADGGDVGVVGPEADAGAAVPVSAGDSEESVLSRMKVSLRREQRAWIEKEAARRGLPKTAIMRELVANALAGESAFLKQDQGGPRPRGDASDLVEGVLVDPPSAGVPGSGSGARAREVIPVVEAAPVDSGISPEAVPGVAGDGFRCRHAGRSPGGPRRQRAALP